jgi:hypothetical protein
MVGVRRLTACTVAQIVAAAREQIGAGYRDPGMAASTR